jgi:hypothetical protein
MLNICPRTVLLCSYHRERDELVHILLNLVESSILSVGPIPEDLISYHPESGITTA